MRRTRITTLGCHWTGVLDGRVAVARRENPSRTVRSRNQGRVWTLVALPAFLACLQAQVALVLGVSLVRRREKRFRTAVLFAWSILSLWFLVFVPRAYVDDIAKFQAEFRASASDSAR